jgi:hypothetical protein
MLPFTSPAHAEMLTLWLRAVWRILENFLRFTKHRAFPFFSREGVDAISRYNMLHKYRGTLRCLSNRISFMARVDDQDIFNQYLLLSPHGRKGILSNQMRGIDWYSEERY